MSDLPGQGVILPPNSLTEELYEMEWLVDYVNNRPEILVVSKGLWEKEEALMSIDDDTSAIPFFTTTVVC